jgi:hypothetical protein
MNDHEKKLLVKMYYLFIEMSQQCEDSPEFNDYLARKEFFAQSLEDIIASIEHDINSHTV